MASEKRVCVFIPCHNEEDIIGNTVRELRRYLDSDEFPYTGVILLVDDGSEDRSFEIARKAGADVLYRHVTNEGLGAATRTGMEIAHYIGSDSFVKFDADLQHDVQDIRPSVDPLLEDRADIVYASRFSGMIHYRMPLVRALGNRFFTWIMRLMTGWPITDAQTGMMCFSRRYLTIFEMPGSYNPPQQALFDACRKGMRYAEVPAQFHKRKTGESFISFKYIHKVFGSLARLAFYYYGFKMFASLGIFLLFLGTLVAAKGLYAYFAFSTDIYAPHGTFIVLSASVGMLSILFGLLSYAMIQRMPYIRNKGEYRYIILNDIVIQSMEKVDLTFRGPKILGSGGSSATTGDTCEPARNERA